MSTLAVHQANFLPWLGFFDKVAICDVFYVLDHVQAPNGRDYHSRTGICVNGRLHWLSVPIVRAGHAGQRHDQVQIADRHFVRKHLATIAQNYCTSPFFASVYADIESIYADKSPLLTDFSLNGIRLLFERLGLSRPILRTSSLLSRHPHLLQTSGSDLMLELTRISGCTSYLSGNGARAYMKPEMFQAAGIGLEFQQFAHPRYDQRSGKSFVPGLSIIDAAMRVGWNGVQDFVNPKETGHESR